MTQQYCNESLFTTELITLKKILMRSRQSAGQSLVSKIMIHYHIVVVSVHGHAHTDVTWRSLGHRACKTLLKTSVETNSGIFLGSYNGFQTFRLKIVTKNIYHNRRYCPVHLKLTNNIQHTVSVFVSQQLFFTYYPNEL